MSKELRKALIRLAYEKPELRQDLLPLFKEAAAKDAPSLALGEAFYSSSLTVAKAVAKVISSESDISQVKIEKPYSPARFSASAMVEFRVVYSDGRPEASGHIAVTHGYHTADADPLFSASGTFVSSEVRMRGKGLLSVSTNWDEGGAKLAGRYSKYIVDAYFDAVLQAWDR